MLHRFDYYLILGEYSGFDITFKALVSGAWHGNKVYVRYEEEVSLDVFDRNVS